MRFREKTRNDINVNKQLIEQLQRRVNKLEDEVYDLTHPFKFKIGDKVVYCATGQKGEVVNSRRIKVTHGYSQGTWYQRVSQYDIYFTSYPAITINEEYLKLIENEEGTNRDNISQNTGKPKTAQHSSKRR